MSCTRKGSDAVAGRRDWRVPKQVLRRMDESIELTTANRRCTLAMAFKYRGRAEMVDAVLGSSSRSPPRQGRREGHPVPALLPRPTRARPGHPDVGEHRISNFLLWQLAYGELVFDEVL